MAYYSYDTNSSIKTPIKMNWRLKKNILKDMTIMNLFWR